LSYETMPDLVFTIEDEFIAGDAVAQFGVFTATVAGPMLGLSPTNRSVSVPMSARYQFRDGLIESERVSFDLAVFAEQSGYDIAELQQVAGIETETSRAAAVVRTYAEAKSRADIDAALTVCTEGFELHTAAFRMTSQGQAASRGGLELWFKAFPDYRVDLDGLIASSANVSCWGTIHATMAGDLGPVTATNRRCELPFSCVFKIEDGLIAREDFHFDLCRMASQLDLDLVQLAAILPAA
jgi:predicted ester cyclase